MTGRALVVVALLALAGCATDPPAPSPVTTATTSTTTSGSTATDSTSTSSDPESVLPLDKARAQKQFQTTTDLMRWVFAPSCAAERNECHQNEDFPDMSTEGNLWNLVNLPCNQAVGDRKTVEDFCEPIADELWIGPIADPLKLKIASIATVLDEDNQNAFLQYEIRVDQPPAELTSTNFVIARGGQARSWLGSGGGGALTLDGDVILIKTENQIPSVAAIRGGDENENGTWGAEEAAGDDDPRQGVVVRPGDVVNSYLARRLFADTTVDKVRVSERVQMPTSENADTPNEKNNAPTPDEMYAIMSWINCMQEGDGAYSPIRYDCDANSENEGTWPGK